jgi:hypothetical protein
MPIRFNVILICIKIFSIILLIQLSSYCFASNETKLNCYFVFLKENYENYFTIEESVIKNLSDVNIQCDLDKIAEIDQLAKNYKSYSNFLQDKFEKNTANSLKEYLEAFAYYIINIKNKDVAKEVLNQVSADCNTTFNDLQQLIDFVISVDNLQTSKQAEDTRIKQESSNIKPPEKTKSVEINKATKQKKTQVHEPISFEKVIIIKKNLICFIGLLVFIQLCIFYLIFIKIKTW